MYIFFFTFVSSWARQSKEIYSQKVQWGPSWRQVVPRRGWGSRGVPESIKAAARAADGPLREKAA